MKNEELDITGVEQLVQRFLDQELSAEERVRFISRLGRDEALRRRAIELERLVLDASRLPRPIVPDGFVAAVMERTASQGPPTLAPLAWWRRFGVVLWAPRDLRWNLASAVAVACLALFVLGGVVAGRWTLKPGGPAPASGAPDAVTAASAPTVLVRLVVLQPNARTMQVAGDFNGWNPARTSLEQIANGAWAVTIPLKPGRYEYMFVVDGKQWIVDPFAAEQNEDGFGSRNAVLDVRPPVGAQL